MAPALLIGLMAMPLLLLMLLRVNATLVFLSVCLGNILMQFVSDDAAAIVESFMPSGSLNSENNIKLVLLLLPVILTTVFMIKTVQGSRLALNLLPAVGVGLLLALLAVPLLPPDLSREATSSPIWQEAQKLQDLIIGASALTCLFVLWLQRPKVGDHERHGKHHK